MGESPKLPAVRESSRQPTKGGDSKKPAKGEEFQNTPSVGEDNKVPLLRPAGPPPEQSHHIYYLVTRGWEEVVPWGD